MFGVLNKESIHVKGYPKTYNTDIKNITIAEIRSFSRLAEVIETRPPNSKIAYHLLGLLAAPAAKTTLPEFTKGDPHSHRGAA